MEHGRLVPAPALPGRSYVYPSSTTPLPEATVLSPAAGLACTETLGEDITYSNPDPARRSEDLTGDLVQVRSAKDRHLLTHLFPL